MASVTDDNQASGEPKKRGVFLGGQVLAMAEQVQQDDHRGSLTNAVEVLVREAYEARRRAQAKRTGGEAGRDMGAGGNATGANPEYPAYTTGGTADERAA